MKVGLYAATIAINSLNLKRSQWKSGYSLWILEGLLSHMLCVEIWLIYYSVPVKEAPPKLLRMLAKIRSQTLLNAMILLPLTSLVDMTTRELSLKTLSL
jgi:cytochrome b561